MTDEVKVEILSFTDEELKARNVDRRPAPPEEMTVTKTEVKEEAYDVRMADDEKVIGFECVLLPENGIFFTGKTEVEERFGENLESFKTEGREFETNGHRCDEDHLEFKDDLVDDNGSFVYTDPCERTNARSNEPIETIKTFGCDKCRYVTRLRGQLRQHARIHSSEKPFRCTYEGRDRTPCGYATVRRNNLRIHVLLRHSDEKKKYACKRCPYSTHIRGYLLTHMHTHSNEKPFKCAWCEYATTRKDTLQTHALLKHSGEEKRFRCRDCEYSTHLKGNLARHVQVHANKKVRS